MGIVLTAAGLPLDGIGLILAIDRVLDQFRLKSNYVTALSEE
jgi:proton glutamate symport protein